jgi:hypothetical protein
MPTQKLKLIDAIQRLGVSYQFENEIQEILQQLPNNITLHHLDDHKNNDELYDVAFLFQLLRKYGYYISCGTLLFLLYIYIYIFLLSYDRATHFTHLHGEKDMFAKFMDSKGKFKESLIDDA